MSLTRIVRLPEHQGTMAKRKYKIHKNGSGIQIYQCEQCGKQLDDISTRGMKRKICDECETENRRMRDRIRYRTKNIQSKSIQQGKNIIANKL